MDAFDQVIDFFRRLFMSPIDRAKMNAQSKVYNTQARVKSKVANSFNKAVDTRINAATEKVKGKVNDKVEAHRKGKDEGEQKAEG